jgi:hypothetical protein
MHPSRLMKHRIAIAHIKMACQRGGLNMRVNSDTTASFGRANDKTPGQKPIIIHMIALDICSGVNTERCRPLPYETDLTVTATAAQLQSWRKPC